MLGSAPEDREVDSAEGASVEGGVIGCFRHPINFSPCDNYLKVCAPLEKFLRTPMTIGADSTGATGTFAPVLTKVLGREYSFAPVLFWPLKISKIENA